MTTSCLKARLRRSIWSLWLLWKLQSTWCKIYLKSALFKLASDSNYWDTQMEHKRISIQFCNCRHTNHMYVQEVLDDDDEEQEFFFPSSARWVFRCKTQAVLDHTESAGCFLVESTGWGGGANPIPCLELVPKAQTTDTTKPTNKGTVFSTELGRLG